MWSPYAIPGCTGHLVHSRRYGDDDEIERDAYSHEEYIHMVLQAGSFLSHDYTNGTIDEEPCMIAFFDSLIQREIEQSVDDKDDEDEGGDENVSSKSEESGNDNNKNSDGDDDGGGGGDDDGGGGGGKGDSRSKNSVGGIHMSESDAPLCRNDSSASQIPQAANASTEAADSENEDSNIQGSAVSESRSRAYYLGLESSSSDSDSEVDEILSAMYSRYMSSHEQAINSSSRPASKKISSVIARGKQRESRAALNRRARGASESVSKKQGCPGRLQRIREDLQHSEDQFLRDNATSMSVLADVIDSFVDNLVPDGSGNSRTLSDTNDGHMSSDSNANNNVMAEDSRLIGISTAGHGSSAHGSKNKSARSCTSTSRSFPFASAISPSVGTDFSNTQPPSDGRYAASTSASSSNFSSLQNTFSTRDKPDCKATSSGLSSNSSKFSFNLGEIPTSSGDCQTNRNKEVNGKNKKLSTQNDIYKPEAKDRVKIRHSFSNRGLRDIPAQSMLPNQPFRSDTIKNSEAQGKNNPFRVSSAKRAGNPTESSVVDRDEFVAPEEKPVSHLCRKPSLLSVSSHTSSSSSLSSDPSFTDSSAYLASSSHETDSSKENQEEGNSTNVFGVRPENGTSNTVVQFKRTKIKGRHFRSKKIDSDSSSEEER